MKTIFLTAMLNFVFFTFHGQESDCKCNYYSLASGTLEEKLTCIVLPLGDIKLPKDELFSQWNYGNIILNNGEIISNQFMRYDGLYDQLIISSKNPDYKLAVEKFTIQGFDIGTLNSDKFLHYRRLNVKEKYATNYHDAFLQVLVLGKNTLYAYRKLNNSLVPNELTVSYSYFIKKEDGSIETFVNLSRRSITKMFPEKLGLYRTQLRKQHNRVRDEENLIKAIALINKL